MKMSGKKFSAKSTALEVIEGHDLTGYDTIITGAASGIGVETARALAKAGARVVIATRDLKKAEEVALTLRQETGNEKIEFEQLDLASLKNVQAFVQRYSDTKRPLHILINNARYGLSPIVH
jgi:short-subunit dehydrogenase